MNDRLLRLGRFGLRALRITASTVSILELLRSDLAGGLTAGLAWLVFVQVQRRLPPDPSPDPSPDPGSDQTSLP
jgi:hypothetical protein